MSDSFIEQNLDRANIERSADLEMDESNNTFKHAQLEGTRPGKKWYCWNCNLTLQLVWQMVQLDEERTSSSSSSSL